MIEDSIETIYQSTGIAIFGMRIGVSTKTCFVSDITEIATSVVAEDFSVPCVAVGGMSLENEGTLGNVILLFCAETDKLLTINGQTLCNKVLTELDKPRMIDSMEDNHEGGNDSAESNNHGTLCRVTTKVVTTPQGVVAHHLYGRPLVIAVDVMFVSLDISGFLETPCEVVSLRTGNTKDELESLGGFVTSISDGHKNIQGVLRNIVNFVERSESDNPADSNPSHDLEHVFEDYLPSLPFEAAQGDFGSSGEENVAANEFTRLHENRDFGASMSIRDAQSSPFVPWSWYESRERLVLPVSPSSQSTTSTDTLIEQLTEKCRRESPVTLYAVMFYITSAVPFFFYHSSTIQSRLLLNGIIRAIRIKHYVFRLCYEDNVSMQHNFIEMDNIRNIIEETIPEYRLEFPEDAPLEHLDRIIMESDMASINSYRYGQFKHQVISHYLDLAVEAREQGMFSAGRCEHYITMVIYEMLCSSVVVTGRAMETIWRFDGKLWKSERAIAVLSRFVTLDFIRYMYINHEENFVIHDIIDHLYKVTVLDRIVKKLRHLLYSENFEAKLNSNRNLICLGNGIYDMRMSSDLSLETIEEGKCLLEGSNDSEETVTETQATYIRCPLPSDMCSISTKTPYEPFDEASDGYLELMSIMSKIFPDPEVLEYFIASCSSFLDGYNRYKHVYVWWGRGNNAKSVTQQLVMSAFGDYCSTCPVSLITGTRQSSHGATPEFGKIEGRLVVFLQEPNPGERVRAGQLKELSGNDTVYARDIFGKPRNIEIKAKLVLVTNGILEIPGLDLALRRRIVVIPFESTFVADVEASSTNNHVFPLDDTIEQRLKDLAPVFMSMLIHKRNTSRPDIIPKKIIEKTKEYMDSNNHSIQFVQNNVVSSPGHYSTSDSIYSDFKVWFSTRFPARTLPSFDEFRIQLNNYGFNDDDNGLIKDCYVKPLYNNGNFSGYITIQDCEDADDVSVHE